MSLKRKIVSLAMILLTVGCGISTQRAMFTDVDSDGWCSPAMLRFTVSREDTLAACSMQLYARYGERMQSRSLEMMITVTAPDGVQWSEPFTMQIPAASKSHDLASAIYRHDVRWSQCGEYSVSFTPQHIYRGVMAIGVELVDINVN